VACCSAAIKLIASARAKTDAVAVRPLAHLLRADLCRTPASPRASCAMCCATASR
jgi:hypothetical protein